MRLTDADLDQLENGSLTALAAAAPLLLAEVRRLRAVIRDSREFLFWPMTDSTPTVGTSSDWLDRRTRAQWAADSALVAIRPDVQEARERELQAISERIGSGFQAPPLPAGRIGAEDE